MRTEMRLIRCMGGRHCSHTPGTCTATNVEYQAKAKDIAAAKAVTVQTDDLAAQMVREMMEAGATDHTNAHLHYVQRYEAIARRYIEKAVADKQAVIDLAKQELREIYSGDEGPVLLRTVQAKCARRHEAGEALKRLTRAERAGKEPPHER